MSHPGCDNHSMKIIQHGMFLKKILCVMALALALTGMAAGNASPATTKSAATAAFDPGTNRLFALGMIETGNRDSAVGASGEVSRYQVSPLVWRACSGRSDFDDPALAALVARRHWEFLANYFRGRSGRSPTDFDMYVLWNTRFGYYAQHHFDPRNISGTVRERAGRFVNLVNRRCGASPLPVAGNPCEGGPICSFRSRR